MKDRLQRYYSKVMAAQNAKENKEENEAMATTSKMMNMNMGEDAKSDDKKNRFRQRTLTKALEGTQK